ncbi:alcohol dehydrogenase catalytic domain-containing protein [Streptomyces sp. NPDC048331]|uniref:alcohol dehydrogenase catalytic domain-containing protein n=1 Tax=Streptomyces sp. NPDC048331 TaxID=3365534 RepID=UPI003714643F
MRALTWHGKRDVRVDTVPDPRIRDRDDVIVKITTTGLCGSDLHLYEVLGAFLDPGDILGHEPMGIVEEVGPDVTSLRPGDRVVIPFNISCGSCFMCDRGLHSQCETTQVHEHGTGASLFGYTKLYGQVPGGQAQYLRVPFGNSLPVRVPDGPPDDRFVYLSDVLPTAWQAVEYAAVPRGGSVAVMGLGPIGDMSCRIAAHRGAGTVIGIIADAAADLDGVRAARQAVLDTGMVPLVIAPTGGALDPHGDPITIRRTYAAARSTEFDALLLAGAPQAGADAYGARDAKAGTARSPRAVDPRVLLLVTEAYRHGKAIGGWNGADRFLETVGITADDPGIALDEDGTAVVRTVTAALAEHRAWDRFPPAV